MTRDSIDPLQAAMRGTVVYKKGLVNGNHPFSLRLWDFLAPVGNMTGWDCLLHGHRWYLGKPARFGSCGQFHIFQQNDRWLPSELGPWDCYCARCGAGTRFEEPPEESIMEQDYWCYNCSEVVDGEGIVQHARNDFVRDGHWPTYGEASVHAPKDRYSE